MFVVKCAVLRNLGMSVRSAIKTGSSQEFPRGGHACAVQGGGRRRFSRPEFLQVSLEHGKDMQWNPSFVRRELMGAEAGTVDGQRA